MEFVVNVNTVIGFAGFVTACGVIWKMIKDKIHKVDKWDSFDGKIKNVENKLSEQTKCTNTQIKSLKDEQYMQTKVLLATLDGLHQLGCNGEVTKASNELKEFLNERAH